MAESDTIEWPSWDDEPPESPTGIAAEARGAALEEIGLQEPVEMGPDQVVWPSWDDEAAEPLPAFDETDTAGDPIYPELEAGEFIPPEPLPTEASRRPLSALEEAMRAQENEQAGEPFELFPGLSVSSDIQASKLPESLPEDVPEVIEKDDRGRLRGKELRRAWARAGYMYKEAQTPQQRVTAVGEFVHRWRPELARRAGWTEDGYPEPEGLFWLFDLVDKVSGRPLRTMARSLRELEVRDAAAQLSGEPGTDSFGDVTSAFGDVWEDDKGYPEHGEALLRDMMLYFGGSDDPSEILKEEAAKKRGESWADESLDTSAEALNRFGWEIASHPVIASMLGGAGAGAGLGAAGGAYFFGVGAAPGALIGGGIGGIAGLIGGLKSAAGVDEEAFERAKEESIAAGSEGGHFAQGLIALMLFDPLNFLSLGKFGGISGAARSLISKGVGVTVKGEEFISSASVAHRTAGRQQFVQQILETAPDSAEAAKLARVSGQLDRAGEALDSATRGAQLREGLADAAAARGADDLDAFNDLRAATQENARIAQEALDSLSTQFDEVADGLMDAFKAEGRKLPAVPRSAEQAELIAARDVTQAAMVAWRVGGEVRGPFAPTLLNELKETTAKLGLGMDEAEKAWQVGVKAADDQRMILVGFEVGSDSTASFLRTTPVLKDVGASRVYAMARRGELGVDARVASQRPQYNALESLLNKRSGKSFKELAEELSSVRYQQKEGLGRFLDITYIPRKALGSTKGGAEIQAIRGEAANIRRVLSDPKVTGAARAGLKRQLKELEKLYKQSASRKGLSREAMLLREERLVDNMNPAMASLAYGIIKRVKWLDPTRRVLQTLGRGALSVTGQRPQAYTKVVNGRRVLLERQQMTYPPAHYNVELMEQSRHRARSLGKIMWPSVRAKLVAITDDEDMLELAREFVEKGYAAPIEGVKGAEQLLAAVTIRELNNTLSLIARMGERSTIRGKGYQMLSVEQTRKAVAALDSLAASNPEMDISTLRAAIAEYGNQTAGTMEVREKLAAWAEGGPKDLERRKLLNEARLKLALFEGAYKKVIEEKQLMGAELEAAERAEALRPELERLHGEVNRINKVLGSKEVTSEKVMDDLIDELLRVAEDMPGVNLNRDELIPIAIPRRPEYLEAAKGLESEALAAHRGVLRDQIVEMFDEAAANTVMDVMDRWAQIALEQGKVTRKDEWYQQVTGIHDVKTAFSAAMGPGMLFHEYEAAPIFYSQLYRSLENVGVPKKVLLSVEGKSFIENLIKAGVPESVVDELDLRGWADRRLEQTLKKFDEGYKGPPEKMPFARERAIENASFTPEELRNYIQGKGFESDDILNRLVGGDVSLKDLSKIVKSLGVEVKNTGLAELLIDKIKLRLGRRQLDDFEALVAGSKYGLADALKSPLVQDIKFKREELLSWVDTFRTQIGDDVRGYFSDKGDLSRRLDPAEDLLPWEYVAEEIVGRPLLSDDYIGGPSPRLDDYMEANPLGPRDEILDSTTYIPDDSGSIALEAASDYTIESLVPNRERGVFEADIEFSAPSDLGLGEYDYKFVVKREIDPEDFGVSSKTFDDFAKHYEGGWDDTEEIVVAARRTSESLSPYTKRDVVFPESDPFDIGLNLNTPGQEKYTEWLLINKGESGVGVTSAGSRAHFGDTKDIIAHVRFGVRKGPDGKQWMHIEEIKSDVAQGLNKAKRAEKAKVKREEIFGPGDSRMAIFDENLPDIIPDSMMKEGLWLALADELFQPSAKQSGWAAKRFEGQGAFGGTGIFNEARLRMAEVRDIIGDSDFNKLSQDLPTFRRYGESTLSKNLDEIELGGITDVELRDIAIDLDVLIKRIRDKLNRDIDVSPGISADTKIPYESGWIDLAIKRLVAFAVDEADEPIHGISWTTGDVQDRRYMGAAKGALDSQYDTAMPSRFRSLYGSDPGGIEIKDFSFKVSDSVIDDLESAGDTRMKFKDFISEVTNYDVVGGTQGVVWYIYKSLGKEGRKRYGVAEIETTAFKEFGEDIAFAEQALLDSKLAKLPVKDIDFGSDVHGFEITTQLKEHVRKGQALHHLKDKVVRGAMKLEEEGRVSIHAFESATVGTLVHEMGHVLRRNLQEGELVTVKDWLVDEAARLGKLPIGELNKDVAHLFSRGPVRVVDNKGNFTEFAEELFARGFERYLIDGRAPKGASSAVVEAFAKMKKWLTDIYKTLSGNDVNISPEIQRVFDRYIAGTESPQIADKADWQIKRVDVGPKPGQTMDDALEMHRAQVKAAIDRGDDVPAEVLMDYEDLILYMADNAINSSKRATKRAGKLLDKAAKEMGRIADKGAKGGNLDTARENVRKALGTLRGAGKDKKASRAFKHLEAVKTLKAGEELTVKGGSRERHLLEALKAKYEDHVGQITQQLDSERVISRAEARRASAMLTRDILRGEPPKKGAPTGEKRAQLEEAINLVLGKFGRGADPLDVLQRGVSQGVVQRATMALPDRIIAAEKLISDLRLKKTSKKVERQLKNAEQKLSRLREQAQPIKDQILTKQQDPGSALDDAVRSMRAYEKEKNLRLGGVEPTVKAVVDQLADIEVNLDRLKKIADSMDYDFRLPKDVRRDLYEARTAYFNNVEVAKINYDTSMAAFREAETARAMSGMTVEQMTVVGRLVKNPDIHDLVGGTKSLIKSTRSEVSRLSASVQKLREAGKDTSKQEAALAKAQRKIEILEDPAMTKEVVEAAKLIKNFFDERLQTLKDNGILDKDFDEVAFFDRVDIAGYIPHIQSEAMLRKIEALQGKGMLPRKGQPGFAKRRKIAGTIDEINAQARNGVAESIIYHLAGGGKWGDEAAEASRLAGDQLQEALKAKGIEWNNLLDEIKSDAGLDDIFDFFETDPMVLMERYNDSVSNLVADAKFIDDILDLFPLGRELGRYGKHADAMALRLGYERLSSVDQLQTVMRAKLPPELRNFEAMIKQQLAEGTPLDEIIKHLEAQGVSAELISPDIVQGFAAQQWYVPSSVAEYLRYMNKPDRFLGMEANSAFVQTFDGIQSWMKMMATISSGAHLGRNWIGNVVSAVQELGLMALDPGSQLAAMMIWGSWSDKHLGRVLKFAGREMTIKEWREFWQVRGVYDSPLSSEFTRETMGTAALKEVPTIKRLAKQLGATGTGAVLGGLAAGPAGAFVGGIGGAFISAKPFRNRVWTSFVGDVGDAIKAGPKQAIPAIGQHVTGVGTGAVIGSAIAPGVGTAVGALIGGVSMPDYIKMMSGLNQSIEAQARVSMAMAALKRGDTPEMALAAVNRALRNYSDLAPFEKSVLRRVFFFYTWDAGNVRFQLRQLRRKPRAAKVLASFGNGLYKGQFTEEEIGALPEHLRWRVLFRTGASKLIAISGLPHEPAIEILTRGKRIPMQGIVSRIRPDVLTFVEWAFGGGKSTYYGKQWEQVNNVRSLKNSPPLLKAMFGYPEPGEELRVAIYKNGQKTGRYRTVYKARNAKLMYIAQRVPGYRIINEYNKIVTDTFQSFAMDQGDDTLAATGSERFWAFAFGQKPTTIDWEGQVQYMAYKLERRLMDIIENENEQAIKDFRMLNSEWTGPPEPMEQ